MQDKNTSKQGKPVFPIIFHERHASKAKTVALVNWILHQKICSLGQTPWVSFRCGQKISSFTREHRQNYRQSVPDYTWDKSFFPLGHLPTFNSLVVSCAERSFLVESILWMDTGVKYEMNSATNSHCPQKAARLLICFMCPKEVCSYLTKTPGPVVVYETV